MARSSSPFSNPFSRQESEDRRRRPRQGRFFRPEPEHSRFKFEKLPEIPKEGSDILKPPVESASIEPALTIEVVSNHDAIIQLEIMRVRWYVNEYQRYKELGYDSIIRLPQGVDPENGTVSDEGIDSAIRKAFVADAPDYDTYVRELRETWSRVSGKLVSEAVNVYGFAPHGHFLLAPTAYGTGGGSLKKGGAVFLKLPTYRPTHRRTETEAITHEVLNHEATAELREGTALDDTIFATHQWYKERLMDLLGRSLLIRSGLMKKEDVIMDDYAAAQAAHVVDPLYYISPEHPDENQLRYEGQLPDLIRAVEFKIRETASLSL